MNASCTKLNNLSVEEMCSKQTELLQRQDEGSTANCYEANRQSSITSSEETDKNLPNIVLLGPTGVGKSYFLNGLLGHINPNVGVFPVGMKSRSCTREISTATGKIFDGKLRNYGIDNTLMKVFDTPGEVSMLNCL